MNSNNSKMSNMSGNNILIVLRLSLSPHQNNERTKKRRFGVGEMEERKNENIPTNFYMIMGKSDDCW